MIIYTILLILSTFAGLMSGFYFGYLKRENEPPPMPNPIPTLTEMMEDMKKKAERPSEEELKENEFYR